MDCFSVDSLLEAQAAYDAAALEAEVVWGKDIKPLTEALREQVFWVQLPVRAFLRNVKSKGIELDKEHYPVMPSELHPTGNDDEMSTRIGQAITGIENYLKPFLR